jgi:hypothetical protein
MAKRLRLVRGGGAEAPPAPRPGVYVLTQRVDVWDARAGDRVVYRPAHSTFPLVLHRSLPPEAAGLLPACAWVGGTGDVPAPPPARHLRLVK